MKRNQMLHRLIPVWMIVTLAACAANAGGSERTPYIPDRISQEEIAATTATTALELVERLRPQWLRRRGQDSFRQSSAVVVYVNSRPTGSLSILQQIPIADIREMEYLNSRAATQRFGTGHGSGVILVRTR